jgi:hypothetical protein
VQLSFGLAAAFGGIVDDITSDFPAGTIMDFLAQAQSLELRYVELSVLALYNPLDFYVIPFSTTQKGTATGTPMSPFCAYPLQSNRVRTDIRRGNKRFAGVTEGYVKEGGEIEGVMLTVLEALGTVMTDPLVYDDEGTDLTYTPVVLSMKKNAPDADHDEDWYSLYPTEALQLEHAAIGVTWAPKTFMTTQNTRK